MTVCVMRTAVAELMISTPVKALLVYVLRLINGNVSMRTVIRLTLTRASARVSGCVNRRDDMTPEKRLKRRFRGFLHWLMCVFVLVCVNFTFFDILERFNANKYAWYVAGSIYTCVSAAILAVIFRKEGRDVRI
jgi:hypothetical protein